MATKTDFVDKLSSILVKNGVVKESEAEAMKKDFHQRSKEAFDFFLLDQGLVAKDDLLKALSDYYKVPAIDVVGLFFDHDLVRNFPKDFLIRNVIIPYEIDEDILTVIAGNPADTSLVTKIGQYSPYVVELRVGFNQDIIDTIREFYQEPPEGYIEDLTDEDEPEDHMDPTDLDDLIEKKDRW
jgi:type IV pilus assembly protein PilB